MVALGGPLSYVFDHRDRALAECRRVVKRNGVLVVSAISMWGTSHRYLDQVLALGAEVNHVPEPPWIAAMAASPFRKIEHDAAGRTLDLIGCLGAVPPKLRDHGAESTNQIQRDVIGNEHGFLAIHL